MNANQVKGAVKEAAGETQKQVGKVIGSKEQEAKGLAREQAGKVQKKVGDVQDAVSDAVKKP